MKCSAVEGPFKPVLDFFFPVVLFFFPTCLCTLSRKIVTQHTKFNWLGRSNNFRQAYVIATPHVLYTMSMKSYTTRSVYCVYEILQWLAIHKTGETEQKLVRIPCSIKVAPTVFFFFFLAFLAQCIHGIYGFQKFLCCFISNCIRAKILPGTVIGHPAILAHGAFLIQHAVIFLLPYLLATELW